MYLNVILTILVIVLIVIWTTVYLWWKQVGVKLSKIIGTFKQGLPMNIPGDGVPPLQNVIPDLKNSIGEFRKAMDMLNKMKK